ncbi:uncharacterized protein LOC112622375 [Theropithecus gelada]|uniref:uncharacterized protein LOC112622375 n=1 Tax=Theropithecus gelada TaxID=9565 RepID=UPI000DC16C91|nr:uncharacterized protein LOC112622375 [Theropithecus gelada]
MGKSNPPNLVTQEDLTVYTKWLVCHLQSLRTVHQYLQALQYLPISKVLSVAVNQVAEVGQKNEKVCVNDIDPDVQGSASPDPVDTSISGPMRTEAAFVLPQHTTEIGELKPQLKLLLSHFDIPYDVEELWDSAKEMELFSLVSQKFQSIFMEQQRLQTFPDYEAGIAKADNLGLAGPRMTLKKRANWISFITIKPKCDPWQRKLLTKLKERRRTDALLQLQAKFLKISNPERVMQVLQDHAAKIVMLAPHHPSFVASQGLHQCDYDQVWENIYSNINLCQNKNMKDDDLSMKQNGNDLSQINLSQHANGPLEQIQEMGYNYAMTLQLLGLDDGTEPSDRNPVLMRGAYLSFLYLRHLRIRELQRICLGILNYFRSVERTLTINTSGLTLVSGKLVPTMEDSSWVNMAKGGLGTSQGLGAHHYVHETPAEHKVHGIQFMEFSEVENQDDYYSTEAGCIHTQDQQGVHVMYEEALSDLKELEAELLLVASHYIEKERGHKVGSQPKSGQDWGWAHAGVDRFAVLSDIWTWEAALLENKRQLLDSYFEAYQHTLDPEERFALAQVMTDIVHRRPRFDLSHPYFVKAYREECTCLRLHLQLVRGILTQQIERQREYVQRIWREDHLDNSNTFGLPLNIVCKQLISINNSCPASKNVYLLEFHPSLSLVAFIPKALEHLFQEACRAYRPTSASGLASLERHVLQLALGLWLTPATPEACYSAQLQKDLFSAKVMGDPFLVGEIGLLAFKSAADEGRKQGQDSHVLLLEMFSKLLELLTLRHRLIEMSLESAHLARLYKELAWEMGFEEFHLYLRPVHFEFASHRDRADQPPPVFITSLLEDSGRVDRYSPTALVLAISEVDDNQIGKFSFYTKEAILKLLLHSGVENMQVTLACQATQKNALMVAVQQVYFYHTPQGSCPANVEEISSNLRNHGGMGPTRRRQSRIVNGIDGSLIAPTPKVPATLTHSPERFQATKRMKLEKSREML